MKNDYIKPSFYIKQKLEISYNLIDGERLLSVVVGVVVNVSTGKPSDFHDTRFSVSPSLFKV